MEGVKPLNYNLHYTHLKNTFPNKHLQFQMLQPY